MARIFRNFIIVWAAAFGFASCIPETDSPEGQVAVGKAHFQGYGCNTCHQVGGEGGVLGPDLTLIGFRKSPEWLDLWLKSPEGWKHNTLMPNFYLKENVRKPLVAYLSSLKGEAYADGRAPWNAPEFDGDPVRKGEAIFKHAGCAGCHGVEGKGGYPNNNVPGGLIPSLSGATAGYSKEELADKITKGVPQSIMDDPSAPPPMIHMPTWGEKLSKDEIDALVEYIFDLYPVSEEDAW